MRLHRERLQAVLEELGIVAARDHDRDAKREGHAVRVLPHSRAALPDRREGRDRVVRGTSCRTPLKRAYGMVTVL
ncbi:hypothetical protein GCM10009775_26450 [Microbacterium aoyamense]|uniref:Uncharacterized protein n=1 Tax=Microbacterium aoyamense TaxID=344166 RepID=A0ABP5B655_9MICO